MNSSSALILKTVLQLPTESHSYVDLFLYKKSISKCLHLKFKCIFTVLYPHFKSRFSFYLFFFFVGFI